MADFSVQPWEFYETLDDEDIRRLVFILAIKELTLDEMKAILQRTDFP